MMVQKKALELGSELALKLGDEGAHRHYVKIAEKIGNKIEKYFYVDNEIISSVIFNHGHKKIIRKYDSSIILAFLHTGYKFNTEFANSVCKIVKGFKKEYNVNHHKNKYPNLLIGRYFGDIYYGGNPWVLATAGLATFLMNVDYNSLNPTILNKGFFNYFGESNEECKNTAQNLYNYLIHIESLNKNNSTLSFSEQIDRNNKSYLSADRLTWNYVELLRINIYK